MTDRRQYPRWTVERRQLPPAPRPSWWWPVIVIPWIFYVAAGGSSLSTEVSLRSTGETSEGHSVAAPFNVTAGQERKRRMGVEANPQGLSANDRTRWGNNASSDTVELRTHAPAVTPQTAAFPDRTCWVDSYPLEYFCFVLSQVRG